jgi:flagellar hook-associated protein 2
MSSILPTSSTTSPTTSSAASTAGSAGSGILSSTGLGSGIDINSLVTQLVAAEGNPQTAILNNQQSTLQAQVSAYGALSSAVAGVQTAIAALSIPSAFTTPTANVGDSTVASATADSTAVAGSYNLSVGNLATAQQLASQAYASTSTAVGTGTLTLAVNGQSFQVSVGSTNNTVSGIAAAINSASGNTGISASLLTANDGVHLILTSNQTGAANTISVTQTGGDGGLASLVYDPSNNNTQLTQLTQAKDAQITLDGYAYSSASNTVANVLQGVTINLAGPSATGVTTPLTIGSSSTGAVTAVQTFVTAYNTLNSTIGALTQWNSTTQTGGPLLGDATTTSLITQLNDALNAQVSTGSGSISSLADIGVTKNADGSLAVDSSKLSTALQNNGSAVANLFASTSGIASGLNTLLNGYTDATGVFATKNSELQTSLTTIQTKRTALAAQLSTLQATLFTQFNAMDALVGQLKNTSAQLTASLASLPTNYGPSTSSTSG